MIYVGIDIGKTRCAACVTDAEGSILRDLTYMNSREEIRGLARILVGYGECAAVLESTGNLWLKTYEVLEAQGIPVKLANPLKTRTIAQAQVKTDKIDSETLAHLLRADLVPEAWVPPKETRELRELVKRWAFLVRKRTRLKNRVHAELAKRDITPGKPPFTRRGREVLQGLGIEAVNQLLPVIEVLNRQIAEVSSIIEGLAIKNGNARLLSQLAFRRFLHIARKRCSYS